MLCKIVKFFEGIFSQKNNTQSDIDAYITAHNPSSVADVEYLINQFERAKKNSTWASK